MNPYETPPGLSTIRSVKNYNELAAAVENLMYERHLTYKQAYKQIMSTISEDTQEILPMPDAALSEIESEIEKYQEQNQCSYRKAYAAICV